MSMQIMGGVNVMGLCPQGFGQVIVPDAGFVAAINVLPDTPQDTYKPPVLIEDLPALSLDDPEDLLVTPPKMWSPRSAVQQAARFAGFERIEVGLRNTPMRALVKSAVTQYSPEVMAGDDDVDGVIPGSRPLDPESIGPMRRDPVRAARGVDPSGKVLVNPDLIDLAKLPTVAEPKKLKRPDVLDTDPEGFIASGDLRVSGKPRVVDTGLASVAVRSNDTQRGRSRPGCIVWIALGGLILTAAAAIFNAWQSAEAGFGKQEP